MNGSIVTIDSCALDQSIRIVRLPARLDSSAAEKITAEVIAAFDGNPGGILFDLKDVIFVSSAGIRMFMTSYKKARAGGIKAAMAHVHPNVYKIFKVAALEGEFNIHDSEEQALKEVWQLQPQV
jgi:anti-anti-sigma factor